MRKIFFWAIIRHNTKMTLYWIPDYTNTKDPTKSFPVDGKGRTNFQLFPVLWLSTPLDACWLLLDGGAEAKLRFCLGCVESSINQSPLLPNNLLRPCHQTRPSLGLLNIGGSCLLPSLCKTKYVCIAEPWLGPFGNQSMEWFDSQISQYYSRNLNKIKNSRSKVPASGPPFGVPI